jgi:hypothetical protein
MATETPTPPTSDAIAPSDAAIAQAFREYCYNFPAMKISTSHWVKNRAIEIDRAREIAAQSGEGDDTCCKDIPDWAIAKSYRVEVGKLNPEYRQSALIFASNVTVAADHLARGVKTQYPYNPAQLAQWLRIHHRSSWDKPEYRIPEIVWIYETLLQLPLSITPDQMKDSPPHVADALDGERWRAVLGCARLRVLGSAGLVSADSGYAHLGLEMWTHHEAGHEGPAAEWLTKFADRCIAARAEAGGES